LPSEAQTYTQRWREALKRTSQANRASQYPPIGLEALVACGRADLARALVMALPSGPEAFRALVVVARALERTPGRFAQAAPLLIRALESEPATLEEVLEVLECSSSITTGVLDRINELADEDVPGFCNIDLAVAVARQRGGIAVEESEIERARARWNEATLCGGPAFDRDDELITSLWVRWYLAREDAQSLSKAASMATRLLSVRYQRSVQPHRVRALMELLIRVRGLATPPDSLCEVASAARAEIKTLYRDPVVARLIEAGNVELLELLASIPTSAFQDYALAVALSGASAAEAKARLTSAERVFNSSYGDGEHRDRFEAMFADHVGWKALALAAAGERDEALSLLAALDGWAIAEVRGGRATCFDVLAEAFARADEWDAAFDAVRKAALEARADSVALLAARTGDTRLLLDDLATIDGDDRPAMILKPIDSVPVDVDPTLRARWLDALQSPDGPALDRRAVVLAR